MSAREHHQKNIDARLPDDFPCLKERQQSLRCLDENNYDYSKCTLAFENFKFCRKFWEQVEKHRKKLKIEPKMPGPEERAVIYQHYKATGKLPDYSPQDR